jgi:hypothetical protein
MKNYIALFFLFFIVEKSVAQEYNIAFSYKYLHANQWDKIIQTYNFSRPFLDSKQPLYAHGINGSFSYIFKSDRKIKHGINSSYSYFGSYAENDDFTNKYNLHFLNIGYILRYKKLKDPRGFYSDFICSITSSGMFRSLNDEDFVYDEVRSRSFGIGLDLALKMAYNIVIKNNFGISPIILVGYTPYFFSPNTEAVINQTKSLVGKNWTGIFTTQLGFSMSIIK